LIDVTPALAVFVVDRWILDSPSFSPQSVASTVSIPGVRVPGEGISYVTQFAAVSAIFRVGASRFPFFSAGPILATF